MQINLLLLCVVVVLKELERKERRKKKKKKKKLNMFFRTSPRVCEIGVVPGAPEIIPWREGKRRGGEERVSN